MALGLRRFLAPARPSSPCRFLSRESSPLSLESVEHRDKLRGPPSWIIGPRQLHLVVLQPIRSSGRRYQARPLWPLVAEPIRGLQYSASTHRRAADGISGSWPPQLRLAR